MNASSDALPIGALSKQTGCNIETIRYYEKAGLLPVPARSPAGYRRYSSTHLKRLTFIRRARALGFSIELFVPVAATPIVPVVWSARNVDSSEPSRVLRIVRLSEPALRTLNLMTRMLFRVT